MFHHPPWSHLKLLLFVLLTLTSCSLDSGAGRHFSRDVADTPVLADQLTQAGIMGQEEGMIRVYLCFKNGTRIELDSSPLPGHGADIDYWYWHPTQRLQLAPDGLRARLKIAAAAHPADANLPPGALGPFLNDLYNAAQP